jgi:hypothetical protein
MSIFSTLSGKFNTGLGKMHGWAGDFAAQGGANNVALKAYLGNIKTNPFDEKPYHQIGSMLLNDRNANWEMIALGCAFRAQGLFIKALNNPIQSTLISAAVLYLLCGTSLATAIIAPLVTGFILRATIDAVKEMVEKTDISPLDAIWNGICKNADFYEKKFQSAFSR